MKNQTLIVALVLFILGLAIVILGALFKIQHFTAGSIDGNIMLIIGMVVEALSISLIGYSILKMNQKKS